MLFERLSGTSSAYGATGSSLSRRSRRTPDTKYAGGHRIRVTPVPIPNTEVKPDTADGTARETVWESRSLPAVFVKKPDVNSRRAFVLYGLTLNGPAAQVPVQYHR